MTGVILQPSFIPWRGVFDLIKKSDVFVFYDDVQYDKHGWRNRNRIRTATGSDWLTIPVKSKGNLTNKLLINAAEVAWDKPWDRSVRDKIVANYRRAPFFKRYFPAIEARLLSHESHLVDYTIPLTLDVVAELGIDGTRFFRSSEIDIQHEDPTERLVLNLSHLGVTTYISGPSAQAYLNPERFQDAGITLEYMTYNYPAYEQLTGPFDPAVSIIDLLFTQGERAADYIWGSAKKASLHTSV